MKISVVINTYNAERLLDECLQSVKNADEILICDMYSTDKTVEIAKKHGCKIYYHEKIDIVDAARDFIIQKASGDWILILDADEIVPEDLWQNLTCYAENSKPDKLVVGIARKNWFIDGFLTCVGNDYQIRFFKNGHLKYGEGKVHVPPQPVDTKIFYLPAKDGAFVHYAYSNFANFLEKQNIYTSGELEKIPTPRGGGSSVFKILRIMKSKFLKPYFKNRAYKDGFRGFVWYFYNGIYFVNIYIKNSEKYISLLGSKGTKVE